MDCKKILIDTNVLIDVLIERENFFEASLKVWELCENGSAKGVISAISVPNVVYVLHKQLTPEKTKTLVSYLPSIFEIKDLRASDIKAAAEVLTSDYEDAVQMCCAKRIKADYIVTRNVKDFAGSAVRAVTPREFLDTIE